MENNETQSNKQTNKRRMIRRRVGQLFAMKKGNQTVAHFSHIAKEPVTEPEWRFLRVFDSASGAPDAALSKLFPINWIAKCPDLPSESAEGQAFAAFLNACFAPMARSSAFVQMFLDKPLFVNWKRLSIKGNSVSVEADASTAAVWWTIFPDRFDSHAFVFVRTTRLEHPHPPTCETKDFFHVRVVQQTHREFAVQSIPDLEASLPPDNAIWRLHRNIGQIGYSGILYRWDWRNPHEVVLSDDLLIASVAYRNMHNCMSVMFHDIRAQMRWFVYASGGEQGFFSRGLFDRRHVRTKFTDQKQKKHVHLSINLDCGD